MKKEKIKNIYGEDVTENIERLKKQFKRGDISETQRDDNIYAIEEGEMY
jgi:hypothetical protein